MSQRVADLLAEGLPPEAVVAFTFTERAAEELKNRITHRVEGRLGRAALDRLAGLFVGTIHAFCFLRGLRRRGRLRPERRRPDHRPRAKGLEWPVVFVPSVTGNRFPTTRAGRVQSWLVPRDRFDAARYEGSDAYERRLFYVALTRRGTGCRCPDTRG